MSDNDMLVTMATANWKGCRCGARARQAADSVRIEVPQGVNYQVSVACPQCGIRHRLTILIPRGVTLRNMYDMWSSGKGTVPKVNLQTPRSPITPGA